MRFGWLGLIGIGWMLIASQAARADLINGGFEAYPQPPAGYTTYTDSDYAGWRTTEADHQIEVWSTGFQGIAAWQGNVFAELNANAVSTLYQDVSGIPAGAQLSFAFAHRGRMGRDVMRMVLTDLGADGLYGTSDDTILFSRKYSDNNKAWRGYSSVGLAEIRSLGNVLRMSFVSVSAAGGDASVGNFLDGVSLTADGGTSVTTPVPEPPPLKLLLLPIVALALLHRRAG